MTLQVFCSTVVPMVASLAYASAGVANLYARNWGMAVVWLCYSTANIFLIAQVTRK